MDELEARTQNELTEIIAVLTELTGLPSRWSGHVELVPEAEFLGRKRPVCDIQLDVGLPLRDTRWATLVHEAIHSISVGYNGSVFRELRGWEEGVVEQLQRLFRPVILGRLGIALANDVFYPEEKAHTFNDYIAALESLRLMLKEDTAPDAKQNFYLDLLGMPIEERPDSVLRSIFAQEQPQRGILLSTFSQANSILKLRAR